MYLVSVHSYICIDFTIKCVRFRFYLFNYFNLILILIINNYYETFKFSWTLYLPNLLVINNNLLSLVLSITQKLFLKISIWIKQN